MLKFSKEVDGGISMREFEILHKGLSSVVQINAKKDEVYKVRSGAMVSMDNVFDLKLESGGFKKAFGRFWGGHGTFLQKFTAKEDGELIVSPSFLGEIEILELDGTKKYILGQSAFLFSKGEVETNIKNKGVNGWISGEGILQMEASGKGTLGIAAYGSIYKRTIEEGKTYIVDTNQLVLWSSELEYEVTMISDGMTSFAGGEGYVIKFKGSGEVWIQTKNPSYLTTPGT